PGRDVERHRVRWLGRDAMRQFFRAYRRRRRFADAQLLVEAGEDCLDADERIRSEVDVRGLLPVAQAARGIIQLDLAGLSPPVPRHRRSRTGCCGPRARRPPTRTSLGPTT